MGVPAASFAAARDHKLLAVMLQVLDDESLLGIDHGRTGRDKQPLIATGSPVAKRSLTGLALGGSVMSSIGE
jgi:hypothetical protein